MTKIYDAGRTCQNQGENNCSQKKKHVFLQTIAEEYGT